MVGYAFFVPFVWAYRRKGGQNMKSQTTKDLLIKVKWKFQNIEFEKKGIRNQAAEQFKIEGRPAKEAFGIGLGLCLCV